MDHIMSFEGYDIAINERFLTKKDLDGFQPSQEVIAEKMNVIVDMVKKSRKLNQELKDFAISHLKSYSTYNSGVVTELNLHSNLKKKIREKELPSGFSMGVDKNGYFIHTHRARSKSFKKPESITIKAIKFIDGTG